MIEEPEQDAPPITELTKGQRRVLGTLLEKAFTTPEAYPLTVKALTAGCNQKSNRHPLTEYSEDDVLDVLDQLRQMGLAAVVHTETGRTERFRHYMRKRFTFTEPQLAVLTELLLRGRQSIGDLRARASRMVPIESLDELRVAPRGLLEQKFVQANTASERREASRSITIFTALPRTRNSHGTPDLKTKATSAAANRWRERTRLPNRTRRRLQPLLCADRTLPKSQRVLPCSLSCATRTGTFTPGSTPSNTRSLA